MRLFGGGQAPPLVKSSVLSLVGAAPVLSPNVLKTPILATLLSWNSGACAQLEATLNAEATATARLNLLVFFITILVAFQAETPVFCFGLVVWL